MNKAQLIEAIKDYPNDAPVVVSVGFPGSATLAEQDYTWVGKPGGNIHAISVSSSTDAIVLEL
jgi:hypothetical protein